MLKSQQRRKKKFFLTMKTEVFALVVLALWASAASCKSYNRQFSSDTIKLKMEQPLSGYPCVLLLNSNGSVGCSRKQ